MLFSSFGRRRQLVVRRRGVAGRRRRGQPRLQEWRRDGGRPRRQRRRRGGRPGRRRHGSAQRWGGRRRRPRRRSPGRVRGGRGGLLGHVEQLEQNEKRDVVVVPVVRVGVQRLQVRVGDRVVLSSVSQLAGRAVALRLNLDGRTGGPTYLQHIVHAAVRDLLQRLHAGFVRRLRRGRGCQVGLGSSSSSSSSTSRQPTSGSGRGMLWRRNRRAAHRGGAPKDTQGDTLQRRHR